MGDHRGLLISGTPGIGKTKCIEKAILKTNAEQSSDYVIIGEQVTKKRLVKTLSNYKNSVIIFDDAQFIDKDCWKMIRDVLNERERERFFDYEGERVRFNGFIILVTNDSLDEIKEQTKEEYGSIMHRISLFDLRLSDK